MKNKHWYISLSILAFILILSACGNSAGEEENEESENPGIETSATTGEEGDVVDVTLVNQEGENIGTAVLEQKRRGVQITLEATNLEPGTHGFHIHEKGVCDPPDFESAGGHFNPTNAEHGFDNPQGPHAGDLPNIEVGKNGEVHTSFLNDMVTLKKGEMNSLLQEGGTALIIHSKADDYVSQPAGDAGERIACGVIAE